VDSSGAEKLSTQTHGAFDVTLTPRVVTTGLSPRHQRQTQLTEAGRWEEIVFPESGSHLVAFQRSLKIDLDGVARAFAVDKAIDYLASLGLAQAVVEAESDRRIHRRPACEFAVGESHESAAGDMLRPALVSRAAFFVKQRLGYAKPPQIIHPRTGRALKMNQSVSVYAPSCLVAEALTRAVLIAPQSLWNEALSAYDSLALFVTRQGEKVLFPNQASLGVITCE
jgi:FAD:protein FMN transferase